MFLCALGHILNKNIHWQSCLYMLICMFQFWKSHTPRKSNYCCIKKKKKKQGLKETLRLNFISDSLVTFIKLLYVTLLCLVFTKWYIYLINGVYVKVCTVPRLLIWQLMDLSALKFCSCVTIFILFFLRLMNMDNLFNILSSLILLCSKPSRFSPSVWQPPNKWHSKNT